ncbi:MAG: PilC/PilY family type IV pilus protein [Deltaproteobacteria bacterium]
MKKLHISAVLWLVVLFGLVFSVNTGFASDMCMFAVTADDLPPNIVILIDNGTEMKQTVPHGDYDSSVDYTPTVGTEVDVVPNGASGNGFYNKNGYGIFVSGGRYYLVPVEDNLMLNTAVRLEGLPSADKKTSTWTINGVTAHLPAEASAEVDADGIKDNAGFFRYSKNYLNWLFFYTSAVDLNGDGIDEPIYDGTALPDRSRFYYAKKALLSVGKLSSNKAQFAIYNFTSTSEGSSNVQPLGDVVGTLGATAEDNVLDPNYINNINNMGTVIYSPLAEGLATIGGYLDSNSSGSVDITNYCQKNFVIVVSPGMSSEDKSDSNQSIPASLEDFDQDATDGFGDGGPGQGTLTVDDVDYTITTNINGSTYMDDVAHYFYTNDMRISCDPTGAFQNIMTYTVGFMATTASRLYLINTSNNGNGKPNLSNSADPDYGKYHFDATSADGLSQAILDAVNSIISRTSSFTAPVVPVTRTTSGNKIYMAFFKPLEENFWEGNVTKFGLNADNEIIGSDGNLATWPNGAMREDAKPYWATIDWADISKSNGIHNSNRKIYTYLGAVDNLTDTANRFATDNAHLTDMMLGHPTDIIVNGNSISGRDKVINYIRGADVLDEDADTDISENRSIITGDVLHSEPLVFTYEYDSGSAKTLVFFGANDGMLHAVLDDIDPNVSISGDEINYGREAWAFIPPDQLNRLKYIIEGSTHRDYVDSSPKIYFHDVDEDDRVDSGDGDRVILVCGQRKGGSSYFALDVTDPATPKYLWRIGSADDAETGTAELSSILRYAGGAFHDGDTLRLWNGAGEWHDAALVVGDESVDASGNVFVTFDNRTLYFYPGQWLGNLTTGMYQDYMASNPTGPFVWGKIISMTTIDPDVVIPEFGQSWSEPEFGRVKTSDYDTAGTAVCFIGGGFSADHSAGKAMVAVNVFTGAVVKKFTTGMNYSVASTVKVVDEDGNGFVDKIYVGDLGGQMWRFGQVTTDSAGNPLNFPDCNENINSWVGQILFTAPTYAVDTTTYTRKFFYPPSVTLEKGYDLIFMGTGDRENACDTTVAADRVYAVKDIHGAITLSEADLVDVTDPAATLPNLNGSTDQGWFIRLVDELGAPAGEKVLAQGVVFYKTYYFTTFTPNDDPCVPGGDARLYALHYLSGAAVIAFTDTDGDGVEDLTRSVILGGGIPSKPVTVISAEGTKLFISVGSTNVNAASQSVGAGIVGLDPLYPKRNFFYLWWRQIFN